MATQRETLFSSLRTLGRLRRFIFPHWMPIGGALLLLLGDAGMNLLKPWPLKFVFDSVLTRQAVRPRHPAFADRDFRCGHRHHDARRMVRVFGGIPA